nr:retrovirus-related Pol polyprotein from transposon TNT 1-94 [Tanacetum cinerariifolium]
MGFLYFSLNGNVVAAQAEGNGNRNIKNLVRCYNCKGIGHLARKCTVRPRRMDAAYLQNQLMIAQKEEAWIQLQAKVFDLITAAGDLDKIKEVNTSCILMANLQPTSTSGLWYPKETDIETIVYADSDRVRDYVDRKSTS